MMDYNTYVRGIDNIKFFKFLGWFFLICGCLTLGGTLITSVSWKFEEINYSKEYVYSSYGSYYYEVDGRKIYVNDIYNTDKEKMLDLEIPNEMTVIMYCNKNNNQECIYFDIDGKDSGVLNPMGPIIISLFILMLAVFLLWKEKGTSDYKNGVGKTSFTRMTLVSIFLIMIGVIVVFGQSKNLLDYTRIKRQKNVVEGTIYSEIYNSGKNSDRYKAVANYYVDGKKYIYVSNIYYQGYLEEDKGKKIELYYDDDNPEIVVSSDNFMMIFILVFGIILIILGTPFVFFKRKMEERKDNCLQESNKEWKI